MCHSSPHFSQLVIQNVCSLPNSPIAYVFFFFLCFVCLSLALLRDSLIRQCDTAIFSFFAVVVLLMLHSSSSPPCY
ncbi:hypothetical protein CPB84DRAFT_1785116 [Gymnopilus junonius]|uniref:Uncharacterized protein n=1 Tax=Gymnopilus junonius TaxID=109634 RepID=A0A9P5NJ89_GYMJU|nr:hypothetical protein CPB84DRAFT_1785116 [Gymnopilus junonius]